MIKYNLLNGKLLNYIWKFDDFAYINFVKKSIVDYYLRRYCLFLDNSKINVKVFVKNVLLF